MGPAQRIVVNTLAQYTRLLLGMVVSLYATRLILNALGQNDYGIYSLVAGIIAMLAFVTNAMVITTQRHLSYTHGSGDIEAVRKMFCSCLLLHILIAVAVAAVMFLLEPLIFGRLLLIDAERMAVARHIYRYMAVALSVTFVTAPYKALFIARENIVFVSIVDVVDSLLRLLLAIMLYHVAFDRLGFYGFCTMLISFFNYAVLALYGRAHFAECRLLPRRRYIDTRRITDVVGFAGWTICGMGCILARTQGVAVLFNRFFGTVMNTAYGIAQQVFASVQRVSQSVLNAISPQLIKSEGARDRNHMLALSAYTSKYSLLLLALVVIPLCFEMQPILRFWLGDVPPHTAMLCRFVLIASLCDQTTIGLSTANQATGRIRSFTICTNTVKVLTLPIAWICVRLTKRPEAVMWCYLTIEIVCAAMRIPLLKRLIGFAVGSYLTTVVRSSLVPIATLTIVSWAMTALITMPLRFVLTLATAVAAGLVAIWFAAFDRRERDIVKKIIHRKPC